MFFFKLMLCSLSRPDELVLYRLVFDQANGLPRAELLASPLSLARDHEVAAPFAFAPPRLFSISSNGFVLHGATYFPPIDASKRYPAVIYTYGGPSVQLVENNYTLTKGEHICVFAFCVEEK